MSSKRILLKNIIPHSAFAPSFVDLQLCSVTWSGNANRGNANLSGNRNPGTRHVGVRADMHGSPGSLFPRRLASYTRQLESQSPSYTRQLESHSPSYTRQLESQSPSPPSYTRQLESQSPSFSRQLESQSPSYTRWAPPLGPTVGPYRWVLQFGPRWWGIGSKFIIGDMFVIFPGKGLGLGFSFSLRALGPKTRGVSLRIRRNSFVVKMHGFCFVWRLDLS